MLFDSVTVPLPLRVTLPSNTSSVKLPDEFRLRVPVLVMLPKASRIPPFRMFRTSPALLRASAPKLPVAPDKFTLAEAVPMVTALELVGTPALQFPAVFQLLSPAVPVHESEVRGGGVLSVALRADATLARGCWLNSDCCESLRRARTASCAEAEPSTLIRAARKQRTVIHRVTARRDAGRM
jgi:hypothetical protein